MSQISAEQVRREFPSTGVCTFLDTAYQGPFPERGARAMKDLIDRWCRTPGAYGEYTLEQAESVRKKVAKLLGVTPEEILFTRGTGDGMATVANSLLRSGDEVLVGGLEHPSGYATWMNMATRGVKVRLVPHRSGMMAVEDLAAAIGPRTKAIAVCLVNNYNGYRMNLASLSTLCQEHGLYLFIDAVQAIGALNVDLKSSNVTVLSAQVHKWLCSPRGLAVVYVNKQVLPDAVPQSVWFHHVRPAGHDDWNTYIAQVFQHGEEGAGPQRIKASHLWYPKDTKRFESALNFIALVGLEGMVDILTEFGGMAAVESRVLDLAELLRKSLKEHGYKVLSPFGREHSSGITTVGVSDSAALVEYCHERAIYVRRSRSVRKADDTPAVRLGTHLFNNEQDIAAIVGALDAFNERRA